MSHSSGVGIATPTRGQSASSGSAALERAIEAMRSDLATRCARYGAEGSEPRVQADLGRSQIVGVVHTGPLEGDYRWCLEVGFLDSDDAPLPGDFLTVIQLNPSLASEMRSDSTRGKVEKWARARGYGGVRLLNLFAIRSPSPSYLKDKSEGLLVGADNNAWLKGEAGPGATVVTAWGGSDKRWLRELIDCRVSDLIRSLDMQPANFVGRLTKGHYPLHGRCWNRDQGNLGGPEPLLHRWTDEDWQALGQRTAPGRR